MVPEIYNLRNIPDDFRIGAQRTHVIDWSVVAHIMPYKLELDIAQVYDALGFEYNYDPPIRVAIMDRHLKDRFCGLCFYAHQSGRFIICFEHEEDAVLFRMLAS